MRLETQLRRPVSDVVTDAKNALIDRLASRIRLLVLYGSEARGEAGPDSDVDLMVVLREDDPQLKEEVRDIVYDVMWERDFDRFISVYVLPADQFDAQRRRGFSFIRNVEREGVVLWEAA